jgi:ABC-type uncharacterized transport system substrate-binding protein
MVIKKYGGTLALITGILAVVIISSLLRSNKPFIAVIYGPEYEYHNKVYAELERLTKKYLPEYELRGYSPLHLRDLISLRDVCRYVLDKKPAVLVTIARQCTKYCVPIAKRIQSTTPIVFVGCDAPVELGLIDSLDKPGGFVTGAFSRDTSALSLSKLIPLLAPEAKRVLFPVYESGDATNEPLEAEQIQKELAERGVEVKPLVFSEPTSILPTIRNRIRGCDAITCIEGSAITPQMNGIAKIAERDEVVFINPDITTVHCTPFTYGVNPARPGKAAFKIIQQILAGAHPGDIPVTRVLGARDLFINVKACHNCNISDNDIAAIQERIAIDPDYEQLRGRVKLINQEK